MVDQRMHGRWHVTTQINFLEDGYFQHDIDSCSKGLVSRRLASEEVPGCPKTCSKSPHGCKLENNKRQLEADFEGTDGDSGGYLYASVVEICVCNPCKGLSPQV